VLAIVLFVTTLSFLSTRPGLFDAAVGGFPAPSMTGGFLIQGRRASGHLGVDACRCAAGNPQHSLRFLTGLRRVVMRNWRGDFDVGDAYRRHRSH
jgi:hypothetical protein